jgi:hypothetical protein
VSTLVTEEVLSAQARGFVARLQRDLNPIRLELGRREIEAVEAGDEAKELFAELSLAPELEDFLTLPAYTRLE